MSLQGNDSSSGATPKNSLRTILAAVRKAQPGDTILLAPGTYGGGVVLKPGKPGKPITLRAETTGRHQHPRFHSQRNPFQSPSRR